MGAPGICSTPHIEEVFDDPICEAKTGEVGDTACPARLKEDAEEVEGGEDDGAIVPEAKLDETESQ